LNDADPTQDLKKSNSEMKYSAYLKVL